MASPDHQSRSIDEIHKAQLDDFAAMSSTGLTIAIPAALHYCAEYGLGAPAWLVIASADFLCITLKNNSDKKRRWANRIMARYSRDMIDFVRWDEICVIREQQNIFRAEVAKLRALPKATGELLIKQKKLIHEHEDMLKKIGHTVDDAFDYASKRFKKTEASGGWDTMRRSYREVRKNHKDSTQAKRYHVFNPNFLRRLGIKPPLAIRG